MIYKLQTSHKNPTVSPLLLLSPLLLILSFYISSLATISANREEQVISLKTRWLFDESDTIYVSDLLKFRINKMPPKAIFEIGELHIPVMLYPQHGPLSTILLYAAYKLGPEYSVAAMRAAGVLLGTLMLLLFKKTHFTIFLLLYTNAFFLFVLSYTSLFWYVLMLFFAVCMFHARVIRNKSSFLAFIAALLGTLSHIRFFSFSVIFALIFFDLKRMVWATLGGLLGLTPYVLLSVAHKIHVDRGSLEVLFGSPSDITDFVLRYLLSGKFNLPGEFIRSIRSFSSLFFSVAPFADLGIVRNNYGFLDIISLPFFVITSFMGLLDFKKNAKRVLFLIFYIFVTTLSNPLELFAFTDISWQFLLALPIFYDLIANRERFSYLVSLGQLIFSVFTIVTLFHSKTQVSKSEIRAVLTFLESNKVYEVLNLGIFSSIEFESKGKIKSFEAFLLLCSNPFNIAKINKEMKKFSYVVLSDITEGLIETKDFEIAFITPGNSIRIYRNTRSLPEMYIFPREQVRRTYKKFSQTQPQASRCNLNLPGTRSTTFAMARKLRR